MQIIAKRIFCFICSFGSFDNIISSNLHFRIELSTLFLDYSAQLVDSSVSFYYTKSCDRFLDNWREDGYGR